MSASFVAFPPAPRPTHIQRTPQHAKPIGTPRRRLPTKSCASTAAELPPSSAPSHNPKPKWQCMTNCGACCKLDDFEDDVLYDMLKSDADVALYLSLIDPHSGWCKHFDTFSRKCTIYDSRPRFCRATPPVFNALYQVPEPEFDEFAIDCCNFHIENTYGPSSQEADRYTRFIRTPPAAPASSSSSSSSPLTTQPHPPATLPQRHEAE